VASRAYYAVYHLVAALLEEKAGVSRQPWRAEQLMRDFQERFTRQGYLFSSRDAKTFRKLRDARETADYLAEVFGRRRAELVLKDARMLCSRLEG
jgi:uncharacterized protein (UPF0332 family)